MKHITADNLIAWAGSRTAQGTLPILLRRLIRSSTKGIEKNDFPGDASVSLNGPDGWVIVKNGNEWVPEGESLWELSCEAKNGISKPTGDCEKSAKDKSLNKRENISFVFCDPRHRQHRDKKAEWETDMKSKHGWKNVIWLDAECLAQWIETSLSVQVWMANELDRPINGCFTLELWLQKWISATTPELSCELVLTERKKAEDGLINWLSKSQDAPFRVIGDSRAESAAFTCASLKKHEKYADRLIVIEDNSSNACQWLHQEGELQPIFLFTEEPEDVHVLSSKSHVIIASAKRTGRRNENRSTVLSRISREGFIKSLCDMKCTEQEARSLNRKSGRSISILRRLLADSDSALARPEWASADDKRAMIAAALIGEWDESNKGDKLFVSQISGIDYPTFAEQINKFRIMEDSPIEKIGDVWIIKSRIESLLRVSNLITTATMETFMENMEIILSGKTLSCSGGLFAAIADTVILLSEYHEEIDACKDIENRVNTLVRKALQNAGDDRWRTLADILPQLSEAAPGAFLSALEEDLQNKVPAVSWMFSQELDPLFSSEKHVWLLWALEILAWDKKFLLRVINVLAQMNLKLPDNHVNCPSNTLLSFFRYWYPQCGIDVDGRIEQFLRLSENYPDITWRLIETATQGSDWATPNALPRWSEPEHTSHVKVTNVERHKMQLVIFDVMKKFMSEKPDRIVIVLNRFEMFDGEQLKKIIAVIDCWRQDANDEEKAAVRANVINNIYQCNLRHNTDKIRYQFFIDVFKKLCARLMPENLIIQHKWLFESTWVELPDNPHVDKRDELRHRQKNALMEIYKAEEAKGVFQMASDCGNAFCVGRAVADGLAKDKNVHLEWISNISKQDMDIERKRLFMLGLLQQAPALEHIASLGFDLAITENWAGGMILAFTLALRPGKDIRDIIKRKCPEQTRSQYWETPYLMPHDQEDLPQFVADMMENGRPDAALDWSLVHNFNGIKADDVVEMLNALLDFPKEKWTKTLSANRSSHNIAEAMLFISKSGDILEKDLCELTIVLYEAISHSRFKPTILFSRMATDPEFFAYLICLGFEKKDGQPDAIHPRVKIIRRILTDWNIPPGNSQTTDFDEAQFFDWVVKAKRLSGAKNCLDAADFFITKVLINLFKQENNPPFPKAVLDWLERNENDNFLNSWKLAFFNSRGVVCKAAFEGGKQEREVAEKYRNIANNLHHYPRVAKIFDELAEDYEQQGRYEDNRASLDDRRWN